MATEYPPIYTEKAEQKDLWYGHHPCVCSQSMGCDGHNPSQAQIYHNKRLVAATKPKPTLTSRLRQPPLPSTYRTEESKITEDDSESDSEFSRPVEFFSTELPMDVYSAESIPPLHPCIPYHLSFYHLSCAHRSLRWSNRDAFIEQLSCHGASSPDDPGAQYQWRSEVYYKDKKFFQYQSIHFDITRQRPLTTPKLFFCHHRSDSVGSVKFYKHRGFEHAKCRRVTVPPSITQLESGSWKSSNGSYYRQGGCDKCLTDSVVSLQLRGNAARLHIELYRALGSGEGRPTCPKISVWTALVTGKGSPRKTLYTKFGDVLKIVLQLGKTLDRFPTDIFAVPNGSYVA